MIHSHNFCLHAPKQSLLVFFPDDGKTSSPASWDWESSRYTIPLDRACIGQDSYLDVPLVLGCGGRLAMYMVGLPVSSVTCGGVMCCLFLIF